MYNPQDLDGGFFIRLRTCRLVDFTSPKKCSKSFKGGFSSCRGLVFCFMLWEDPVCVALPSVDGHQWKLLVGGMLYYTKTIIYILCIYTSLLPSYLDATASETAVGLSWPNPDWKAGLVPNLLLLAQTSDISTCLQGGLSFFKAQWIMSLDYSL